MPRDREGGAHANRTSGYTRTCGPRRDDASAACNHGQRGAPEPRESWRSHCRRVGGVPPPPRNTRGGARTRSEAAGCGWRSKPVAADPWRECSASRPAVTEHFGGHGEPVCRPQRSSSAQRRHGPLGRDQLVDDRLDRVADAPARIVSSELANVRDVADVVARAVLIHIAPPHRATEALLNHGEALENGGAVPSPSPDVVNLARARIGDERVERRDHVLAMDLIAHLLSAVAEYGVLVAA